MDPQRPRQLGDDEAILVRRPHPALVAHAETGDRQPRLLDFRVARGVRLGRLGVRRRRSLVVMVDLTLESLVGSTRKGIVPVAGLEELSTRCGSEMSTIFLVSVGRRPC